MVWELAERVLKDVERKRIELLLTQISVKLLRRTGVTYDPTGTWIDNAEREHARDPFHAIVAPSNPRGRPYILDPGLVDETDERWRVERERAVPRDPVAFGRASAPLVSISREILLIDPHFNPSEERWRVSLAELLAPLAGRCAAVSRVEVHVTDMKENGQIKWALAWYLDECERRLPACVPAGLRVAVIVWRQRVGGEKLHPRYVLTERGGMRFEVGLDEGAPGQTTDVSLLGETLHQERWQQYQRGTAAFDFVNQVEVVGSRRM